MTEQLNLMQSQNNKPSWASRLDTAKFETICALYRAAHNLEPDETIDTMDSEELKDFKESNNTYNQDQLGVGHLLLPCLS